MPTFEEELLKMLSEISSLKMCKNWCMPKSEKIAILICLIEFLNNLTRKSLSDSSRTIIKKVVRCERILYLERFSVKFLSRRSDSRPTFHISYGHLVNGITATKLVNGITATKLVKAMRDMVKTLQDSEKEGDDSDEDGDDSDEDGDDSDEDGDDSDEDGDDSDEDGDDSDEDGDDSDEDGDDSDEDGDDSDEDGDDSDEDGDDFQFVLRMKPPNEALKGVYNVKREFGIMEVLYEDGRVPVPKPLHYCGDRSVIGTEFFIMEFVKGITLDCNLGNVPACFGSKIYPSVMDMLAKLHTVETDKFTHIHNIPFYSFSGDNDDDDNDDHGDDDDNGDGDDYDGDGDDIFFQIFWQWQLKTWQHNSGTLEHREKAIYEALIPLPESILKTLPKSALKTLSKSHRKYCLTHGDFNFDNIIFDPVTYEIKAILDWEMSCLGDPMVDLAGFLLIYLSPRSLVRAKMKFKEELDALDESVKQPLIIGPSRRRKSGIPSKMTLVKRYCRLAGVSKAPKLNFASAVSCLRWISILKNAKKGKFRGHESRKYPILKKHVDFCIEVLTRAALKHSKQSRARN